MSENKKDCIIVLSGGMDSVTLMHEYKERIALAVTFDYGSNHNAREIECARRQCELLGIRHLVIPLKFMAEYFRSSLLDGAEAIPEGNYDDDNMKSTVVPFRNGIMLSVACGLAESNDHTIYPDCRPGFVDAMGEAMRQGTFNGVQILAPYTLITKGDIARRGAKMGVDYSLTYSCYKGGERHCGKCGTCMERREAFAAAGIDDPTDYED